MKAKEFITALKNAKDLDIADIYFCVGEKTYVVESMGQMGILTDIHINLKEIEIPLLSQVKNIRRDKKKMVKAVEKKIKSEYKRK